MSRLRLLLLLLSTLPCTGARAQEAYFQQALNYTIDVRLDDEKHALHGLLKLTYVNNSPDTLRSIPFHCWPRAYSSDRTAFARQKLRNGQTKFHFAPARDRGTMDSLRFEVNGTEAAFSFDDDNTDIGLLELPQPLPPANQAVITTPFRVKIPKSFSRLGRVGQSYQITQWYPKPALYDRAGWHPMPYLDLGEYYADFGSFEVNITLPENYVVGATGALQNTDERAKLLEKSVADRKELSLRSAAGELADGFVNEAFPPSAATTKTLTYRAENVHDFAWFADKRFKVLHDTLVVARPRYAEKVGMQSRTVDVWALFNETEAGRWIKATDYLKRATRFYSGQVGPYPYPQVTGVMSALSVGGGMEYPMITVIGRTPDAPALDEVLAHEVGHNWFQGILATNERDHPWMDEGINRFYEQRYMARYRPERPNGLSALGRVVEYDRLGYHYTARQGKDQAPDTRSDSLSMGNYWIGAYSKPVLALRELEGIVGTTAFDRAMRAYYDRWKFRHPQPEDFFRALDEATELNLTPWFPEALLTNKTSDWRRGGAPGFVLLHTGERAAPAPTNHDHQPLDLYPANDYALRRKIKFRFATAQEAPERWQLFYAPLAGFNEHDGPLLGAAFHNRTLEPRRLEWLVAPLFGFESGRLNGFMGGRYRLPKATGRVRQIMLNVGLQRFSDFTLARTDEAYDYYRLGSQLRFNFRHAPITNRNGALYFQQVFLRRNRPAFDRDGSVAGTETRQDLFARVGYNGGWARAIKPLAYHLRLEYKLTNRITAFNANHLRLDAEIEGGYQYEAGRFLRYRAYGGVFLLNDLRESAARFSSGLTLVDNAFSDYAYDDLYLGRNRGSWYGQQLGRRQGGFRAPVGSAFTFGTSNSYLTAVNIDVDLPAFPAYVPLGLFLDAGYYGFKALGGDPLSGTFSWVGGVSLTAFKGQVGLYLPLIADPDSRRLLEQRGKLPDRASVRLNLAGWLPWRWVDDLF